MGYQKSPKHIIYFAFCLILNHSTLFAQRPNIIYVLADDLGYGDISILNKEGKIPTPNIDKFASEGIIFTDGHSSSAVCTPTRYSILTGRYNWRSSLKQGVLTGTSKELIPKDRQTVASMLSQNGYETGFIGKWHLGLTWTVKDPNKPYGEGWQKNDFENIDFSGPVLSGPREVGFKYSYAIPASLDMGPYVYVENGKITQQPDRVTVSKDKYSWWREGPTGADFHHMDANRNLFERSMRYVTEHSKSDKPFFLYFALPSPHTPIIPENKWFGSSSLNPYGDYVKMVDDYFGKLMDTVKELGIEENTLIFFVSDNGCSPATKFDELNAKGHFPSYIYRGAKADIFEGGHRVPYFAKWPKKIKAGSQSEEVVCTTDFFATCAEIIGYTIKDNEGEDSYSLLNLLEGNSYSKPLREATVHHSIDGSFAIRQGDWKLVLCPSSGGWSKPMPKDTLELQLLPKYQLYNLKEDPSEKINLYLKENEIAKSLEKLMISYLKNGRSTPGSPQKNDAINFEWPQIDFVNDKF